MSREYQRRQRGPANEYGEQQGGRTPGRRALTDELSAPLPGALRGKFEGSLATDLGGVRVHTGAGAEAAAKTPAAALTLTHKTEKKAPAGGGDARTTVGVGEVVTFTVTGLAAGAKPGVWTASAGRPDGVSNDGEGTTTMSWHATNVASSPV